MHTNLTKAQVRYLSWVAQHGPNGDHPFRRGQPTVMCLVRKGYLDSNLNVTDAGRAALASFASFA